MDMELRGGQEALNSLNELDFLTQEQILMGAMKSVARRSVSSPLRTAMPYSPEMKKNIGIFTNKSIPLSIWAGVRSGERNKDNPKQPPKGIILRFLEKGTKERTTKKGAKRGSILGKNRISGMIDGLAENFVDLFNEDFLNRVNKIKAKKVK